MCVGSSVTRRERPCHLRIYSSVLGHRKPHVFRRSCVSVLWICLEEHVLLKSPDRATFCEDLHSGISVVAIVSRQIMHVDENLSGCVGDDGGDAKTLGDCCSLMVPICVSGTEFHSTGLGSGPVVELQRLLKAVVSSFMWNLMVEHSVREESFSNAVYACSLQITVLSSPVSQD